MIQQKFGLRPDVQLGVVVDEEDEVGVIDEPLAGVVERVPPVNLPGASGFKNSGDLGKNCLCGKYSIN